MFLGFCISEFLCVCASVFRGLTACAADPGHAMQCHACKIRGNVMQCNTKRCSHAGSPRGVKDVECKCNAMQSNVIISPIMHLKVVPNWSAMALNGTKLAPTWCQNDPIRVYSDANPCLQLHESVFTPPVGAKMDQRPPK